MSGARGGCPSSTRPQEPVLLQIGRRPSAPIERCDMCSAELQQAHSHIADLENSTLLCACRACYLLFTRPAGSEGRYCAIPDRYLADPGDPLRKTEWDALEIPVGLAFFLRASRTDTVAAFYPSPAGAAECRLDLSQWDKLAADHCLLGMAEPDVEAVLIAASESVIECFVVPIDACYELIGQLRLHWRGFDGGAEASANIAEFLATVRGRARDLAHG